MKIAVISDTHIKNNISQLIEFVDNYIKNVDMIIHCGDFINSEALDVLSKGNNLIGVHGNVDDKKIMDNLPDKKIIQVENYKIGVFHGHGEKKTTMYRGYDAFESDEVDIIVYGHSHQPMIKTKNGVLLINPGSPTDKRRERWFTFVVIDIDGDIIDLNIKFYPKL